MGRDAASRKTSAEEFRRLVQGGVQRVESKVTGLEISIKGMTVLDVDTSKKSKGSFTMVANSAIASDGKQFGITVVVVNGWLKIDKTIIHLVYNMILKDSSTPAKAKEELDAWMTAIEAKNTR